MIENYHSKRYRENKVFREGVLNNVKRYHKTEKGKLSNERARKKLIKEGYFSKYMKERREKAKREGICINCLKRNSQDGFFTCRVCRGILKEHHKKSK